jgi:hypothetical protein
MTELAVNVVGKPNVGYGRIVVRARDALTRTYWPAEFPFAHLVRQLDVTTPLSLGHPQNCVGAGLAVIPGVLVASVTAVEIAAESHPFLAAYSPPASAELCTCILSYIAKPSSVTPIISVSIKGIINPNSIAAVPRDPLRQARMKRSRMMMGPAYSTRMVFEPATEVTPVPVQLFLNCEPPVN